MNDVMKKRLIGVTVLVIIGVLTPLLLSRCMHADSEDSGRSSMRVYNVQPDGETEPASNRQNNQAADQGQGDEQLASADHAGRQSDQSGDNKPAPSSQSPSEFSTPPVHGDAGDSQVAESNSSSSQPDSQRPSASSSSSSPSNGQSQNQSQADSQDYGSSFKGSQSSQGGNSASGASDSGGSATPAGLKKSSIQGWVVQVASFGERANAVAMAEKLKGQFPVSFTPGQVSGKTWYRVNVGPFDSKQAAQSAADRLSQSGHKGLVRDLP